MDCFEQPGATPYGTSVTAVWTADPVDEAPTAAAGEDVDTDAGEDAGEDTGTPTAGGAGLASGIATVVAVAAVAVACV